MSAVNHDRYDDAYLRRILRDTKTIAMVGASANWNRPSYFAMKYLLDRGYKILPVNPAAAGQDIMGQKVYGSLDELPLKADMVDIFRNSEAAGPITDAAISHGAKVVWMQLGVPLVPPDLGKVAIGRGIRTCCRRNRPRRRARRGRWRGPG